MGAQIDMSGTRVQDKNTGLLGNAIESSGIVVMTKMDGYDFNSFYTKSELIFL